MTNLLPGSTTTISAEGKDTEVTDDCVSRFIAGQDEGTQIPVVVSYQETKACTRNESKNFKLVCMYLFCFPPTFNQNINWCSFFPS